jgi:hypothetical protein
VKNLTSMAKKWFDIAPFNASLLGRRKRLSHR